MSIRVNNDILLNKMMRSSSEINPRHEDLGMKTLNSIYKTRVDKQIDEGNQVSNVIFRNWFLDYKEHDQPIAK
jgi:hypothetical protein